jgi:RNA polymerase sigma-70 factor (family 1)
MNGDIRAFDDLYYKYHTAVFSNIFKLVRQQEAAEDILQDVFAALWENRGKMDRERSVAGWLFVVSHNKAIKFLAKKVKEKILVQEEAAAEIAEISDIGHQQVEYQYSLINEAIENLSPQKKIVFTLCKLEGKTYEEAAQTLGISPQTVKEYVGAALKFIRAYSLSRYGLNAPVSLSFLITFLNHF